MANKKNIQSLKTIHRKIKCYLLSHTKWQIFILAPTDRISFENFKFGHRG